jgi:hypothetical protein
MNYAIKNQLYVPIDYHKRVGETKVRLFRNPLVTLQYIVEAMLFYNPIKIFLLFDIILIGISAVNYLIAVLFQITSSYLIANRSLLLSLLIFAIGLMVVLLKQIMIRQPQ